MKIVTCVAPVNIAVIKYWGKRDEDLILPINDSISATLSTDIMCAKTTIMASPLLKESKFWLNGIEQDINNKRLVNCLKKVKERSNHSDLTELDWHIVICSENNFPTAAGLASSAAGYACLVYALAELYKVKGDISELARQGSGSACRSVYGGWVQWRKGSLPTGEDSVAKPLLTACHWPEMRVVILVVNDKTKKYSSTSGMKRSVETSTLLTHRASTIVPQRIEEMKKAIETRNFQKFAEITIKDSNQFHAICLDTYPPCVYMNDVSHAIADLVHCYNEYKKQNKVAYTFDAGPNACLFLLESEVNEFISIVNYVFPTDQKQDYFKGLPIDTMPEEKGFLDHYQIAHQNPGALKYIIHTKLGEGPKILTNSDDHLLSQTGIPKSFDLIV